MSNNMETINKLRDMLSESEVNSESVNSESVNSESVNSNPYNILVDLYKCYPEGSYLRTDWYINSLMMRQIKHPYKCKIGNVQTPQEFERRFNDCLMRELDIVVQDVFDKAVKSIGEKC